MERVVNIQSQSTIAVLLAAYNGINWIEEQIVSILNQKHVLIHLYISVDLSSDSSYQWCKALESVNKNVTVLGYGERFGGAAKNFYRLIREVDFKGFDYIAFADQDDIWYLDKLSHGTNKMKESQAEGYSANVIAFWKNGSVKLVEKSQPQKELDYLFESGGAGCTHIFTIKAINLIKTYLDLHSELNDFILHDWLSYAILRHNNYIWVIDSVPKMKYRQHDANQIGVNASFKGIMYRINYILSGQVFKSIGILVRVLDIPFVEVSSRAGVFKLALKARHLRRRKTDQLFAFIALFLYGIKGPKV